MKITDGVLKCTLAEWLERGSRVIRDWPVTRVVLDDFAPASFWPSNEYHAWVSDQDSAFGRGGIPHPLWLRLPGEGTLDLATCPSDLVKVYHSRADAMCAMSELLLAVARGEVALPVKEECTAMSAAAKLLPGRKPYWRDDNFPTYFLWMVEGDSSLRDCGQALPEPVFRLLRGGEAGARWRIYEFREDALADLEQAVAEFNRQGPAAPPPPAAAG